MRRFDQEDIRLMATALDGAWNYLRCRASALSSPDQAEITRLELARRIISARQSGTHRHGELLMSALYGVVHGIDLNDTNLFAGRMTKPAPGRSGL
jgi:hypothetical protein